MALAIIIVLEMCARSLISLWHAWLDSKFRLSFQSAFIFHCVCSWFIFLKIWCELISCKNNCSKIHWIVCVCVCVSILCIVGWIEWNCWPDGSQMFGILSNVQCNLANACNFWFWPYVYATIIYIYNIHIYIPIRIALIWFGFGSVKICISFVVQFNMLFCLLLYKTENSKCALCMYGCVIQNDENWRKKIVYGRISQFAFVRHWTAHTQQHNHILIRAKDGFLEWKTHGTNIAHTIRNRGMSVPQATNAL